MQVLICVYVCTYVYFTTGIVCLCVHMHVHSCVHTHMYVRIRTFACIHVFVLSYAFVHKTVCV